MRLLPKGTTKRRAACLFFLSWHLTCQLAIGGGAASSSSPPGPSARQTRGLRKALPAEAVDSRPRPEGTRKWPQESASTLPGRASNAKPGGGGGDDGSSGDDDGPEGLHENMQRMRRLAVPGEVSITYEADYAGGDIPIGTSANELIGTLSATDATSYDLGGTDAGKFTIQNTDELHNINTLTEAEELYITVTGVNSEGSGLTSSFTLTVIPDPTLAPTSQPSLEPTALPTLDPTLDPTREPTASPTRLPTPTPSFSPMSQPTLEPTALPTLDPTLEPTASPTLLPTLTPSFSPTAPPTLTPSLQPTALPTLDPTLEPTAQPTLEPTLIPTLDPTLEPTAQPTLQPTLIPTLDPTLEPTTQPTLQPTLEPTSLPTLEPTAQPTLLPSLEPTALPSLDPTAMPTLAPTALPTLLPSLAPTLLPTLGPTHGPTEVPASAPTPIPSLVPSSAPTLSPTALPSLLPSANPSAGPTHHPTTMPTLAPTSLPSIAPSRQPTPTPTIAPTGTPSLAPTRNPTGLPTDNPTLSPTLVPTGVPTRLPTSMPSITMAPTPLLQCGSGYYRSTTDNRCHKCQLGRYWAEPIDLEDNHNCDICEIGKYTNHTGSSGCVLCPTGTYLSDDAQWARNHMILENCTACPSGRLSTSDRSQCEFCSAGEQPGTNEECEPCAAGKYSTDGVTCVACIPGKFSGQNKSDTCTDCTAGKYAYNTSTAACTSCEFGKYQPSTGSIACINCGYGDYTGSKLAASSCTPCAAGNYSNKERVILCKKCKPGFFSSNIRTANCDKCSPGYYQPQHGETSCIECPAGKVCPSYNHSSFAACRRGTYSSAGSASCTACSAGFYAENKSSTACLKCSTAIGNEYTSLEGSSSCTRCTEDYFWNPAIQKCKSCVEGMKCVDDDKEGTDLGTLSLKAGFYRFSNFSEVVYECPYTDQCRGGNLSGDFSCAAGSEGPLCHNCMRDYSFNALNGRCEHCDDQDQVHWIVYVFFGLLIMAGAVVFVIKRKMPELWDKVKSRSKEVLVWAEAQSEILTPRFQIIWTAYQIIAETQSTVSDVDYPKIFEKMRSWMSLVTIIELDIYVPAACLDKEYNFYRTLVLVTIIPLVLAFLIICHMAWTLYKLKAGKSWEIALSGHFYAIIVIAYVVLPSASTTLLQTFSCQTFEDGYNYEEDGHTENVYETKHFLTVDYKVECYDRTVPFEDQSQERRLYVSYAIFMLFSPMGGPIGTPLAFFFFLYLKKQRIAHPHGADALTRLETRRNDKSLAASMFLFIPYHPSRWFYECIDAVRRVFLTAFLVLLPNFKKRLVFAVYASFIMVLVHSSLQPYIHPRTNAMALCAHVFVFSTFFSGQMLYLNVVDEGDAYLGAGLVLFAILITTSMAMLQIFDAQKADSERQDQHEQIVEHQVMLQEIIFLHRQQQSMAKDIFGRETSNAIFQRHASDYKTNFESSLPSAEANPDKGDQELDNEETVKTVPPDPQVAQKFHTGHYPCYVMPVRNLEKLKHLVDHEEALRRNLLVEMKPFGANSEVTVKSDGRATLVDRTRARARTASIYRRSSSSGGQAEDVVDDDVVDDDDDDDDDDDQPREELLKLARNLGILGLTGWETRVMLRERIAAAKDAPHPSRTFFISHNWEGEGPEGEKAIDMDGERKYSVHPDNKRGTKLAWLQNIKRHMQVSRNEDAWVWFDYFSVPQHNREMQVRAMKSLLHYQHMIPRIIPLVRTEVRWKELYGEDCCLNASGHPRGDLAVYRSRGWCRLEMLTAMTPKKFRSGKWRPGPIALSVNFHDDPKTHLTCVGPALDETFLLDPLAPDMEYTCCAKSMGREHDCDKDHIAPLVKCLVQQFNEYIRSGATEWDLCLECNRLPTWLVQQMQDYQEINRVRRHSRKTRMSNMSIPRGIEGYIKDVLGQNSTETHRNTRGTLNVELGQIYETTKTPFSPDHGRDEPSDATDIEADAASNGSTSPKGLKRSNSVKNRVIRTGSNVAQKAKHGVTKTFAFIRNRRTQRERFDVDATYPTDDIGEYEMGELPVMAPVYNEAGGTAAQDSTSGPTDENDLDVSGRRTSRLPRFSLRQVADSKKDWMVEKLTTDLKWVERRLSVSKDGKTLRISTAKVLAPETEIQLSSIAYIQIGSEEISEAQQLMDEPNKTFNTSRASLFISAGARSVRIRMQQEEEAASLAAELRDLMKGAPSIDGGGGGGGDNDGDNECGNGGDEGTLDADSGTRSGRTGGRPRRTKSVWSSYHNPLLQQAANNVQIIVEDLDFENSTMDSRTQQQQEQQRKHIANENLHL